MRRCSITWSPMCLSFALWTEVASVCSTSVCFQLGSWRCLGLRFAVALGIEVCFDVRSWLRDFVTSFGTEMSDQRLI
jgi:hypothetical protein